MQRGPPRPVRAKVLRAGVLSVKLWPADEIVCFVAKRRPELWSKSGHRCTQGFPSIYAVVATCPTPSVDQGTRGGQSTRTLRAWPQIRTPTFEASTRPAPGAKPRPPNRPEHPKVEGSPPGFDTNGCKRARAGANVLASGPQIQDSGPRNTLWGRVSRPKCICNPPCLSLDVDIATEWDTKKNGGGSGNVPRSFMFWHRDLPTGREHSQTADANHCLRTVADQQRIAAKHGNRARAPTSCHLHRLHLSPAQTPDDHVEPTPNAEPHLGSGVPALAQALRLMLTIQRLQLE